MATAVTFDDLVNYFRNVLAHFPDKRTGQNRHYTLEEAALGAFSVFFMQCPSFLDHQRTLQAAQQHNNAQSLFKITKIPSDNHIRDLLDNVPPQAVFPVFEKIFDVLQTAYLLDNFRFLNQQLLLPLDGTGYFSSEEIHCVNCLVCQHRNGHITYSHSAITPVLVHPSHRRVISLPPEFIQPQDGHDKQDCESVAAKRWLHNTGKRYAPLGVTLLGDDLYSRQPMCETALAEGFHFIFVCKEDSHKTLYEDYVNPGVCIETVVAYHRQGKQRDTRTYRFMNQIPLRDGESALTVNWCDITIQNTAGKTTYHNAFITDHLITSINVVNIVLAGRTRWKIENENNNTLKTKGYHLNHNFGHGKQSLSALLLTLNLLAFLFHTVLEFTDKKYRLLRQHFSRRMTFFEHARTLTAYLFFKNWEDMLNFILQGQKLAMPFDTS